MLLPKSYNPKLTEANVYKKWERSGFFNPDKLPGKRTKPYCIAIPPPNVTGTLHMGHALNAIIQDSLIRWRRMQGYKTLWLPGTDHAGIATQNVVEKELKKEGKTRHDLGREKFLERVWDWKKKYGNIILLQFKRIGASCDWSRTVFTMDPRYKRAVEEAFEHYFKNGDIYRGERVVNWCHRCTTSLSDLELEYTEEQAVLYHIRYPLAGGHGYITVATVRPETMLGDAAVAVNPKDKRYKELLGEEAVLPIMRRKIPIIADEAVDAEFGTGAVKVTPAHDLVDFEISERHNLSRYQVIGEGGKMTSLAGPRYAGKGVFEARREVVTALRKANLLEKEEPYVHRVARCYRCNSVVEPIISKQWFVRMRRLAKEAMSALTTGRIVFHPKRWEKVYVDWLKNVKDWCVSRQIWWGHRIPVFYCVKRAKNTETRNSAAITEGENFIVSRKKPRKCPICGECSMVQDPDVLDTWFSSALWPFATLGWPLACLKKDKGKKCVPKKRSDLEVYYPTQVLSTARDIINLWVARMIFSGKEFLGKVPFRDVYIHATVLTREGKRMSKSLGTGCDPLELIENYGADATRFGLFYQLMGGQDVHFTEDHIVAGRKFCNKIWNATRFVLAQLNGRKLALSRPKSGLSQEDKRILESLDATVRRVTEDLEGFKFGRATHCLYDFFWHIFCDRYLEYSKKHKTKATQQTLLYVLASSLRLLHPFIPFITEELHEKLPIKGKRSLLLVTAWPEVN